MENILSVDTINDLQVAINDAMEDIQAALEGAIAEVYEAGKREKDNPMKTEKRVVEVGETILIVDPQSTSGEYDSGDFAKVVGYSVDGLVLVDEWDERLFHEEYEVIVDGKSFVDGINAMASALKAWSSSSSKTANQQRAELIRRAREFVEESKRWRGGKAVYVTNCSVGYWCDAEFVVDDEKSTVVCLLKHRLCGVIERGIAKCMPVDVFNADIGKAIALARALWIDVPEEFLSAVQPTEAVKGMVVYTASVVGNATVCDKTCTINKTVSVGTFHDLNFCEVNGSPRIINDTNAIYKEVANQ